MSFIQNDDWAKDGLQSQHWIASLEETLKNVATQQMRAGNSVVVGATAQTGNKSYAMVVFQQPVNLRGDVRKLYDLPEDEKTAIKTKVGGKRAIYEDVLVSVETRNAVQNHHSYILSLPPAGFDALYDLGMQRIYNAEIQVSNNLKATYFNAFDKNHRLIFALFGSKTAAISGGPLQVSPQERLYNGKNDESWGKLVVGASVLPANDNIANYSIRIKTSIDNGVTSIYVIAYQSSA